MKQYLFLGPRPVREGRYFLRSSPFVWVREMSEVEMELNHDYSYT